MQPRILSRWTLAATLALVTLGGFTRGSGSGYGCKDQWPLCEGGHLGGLLPRADFNMVVEWSHRWLAATVGILAILTALAAWRHARRWVAWTTIASVTVISIQAWVGRLIVTNDLDADLVSLHLAISMTVAGLLAVVAVATTPAPRGERSPRWTAWLGFGALVTATVLMLGSLVHNVYIPGWPLTMDRLIPNLEARTIAIHFFHRLLAATSLGLTGYLFWRAWRVARPQQEIALTGVAFGAVLINVGLGAAHVFTQVTWSGLIAAHLAVAAIGLVSLIAAAATSAGVTLDQTLISSSPVSTNGTS